MAKPAERWISLAIGLALMWLSGVMAGAIFVSSIQFTNNALSADVADGKDPVRHPDYCGDVRGARSSE